MSALLRKLLATLKSEGLLLQADQALPSVATIIAGEPIRGSWWGHKYGKLIFNTCCDLEDHEDVLCLKLVYGKVTYVHRRLWPAVMAIATSKASWQTKGLSGDAKKLLAAVEKSGMVRLDELGPKLSKALTDRRKACKELETRLLALSTSIHTDSGAHEKALESWASWMKRMGFKATKMTAEQGYTEIQSALEAQAGGPLKKPFLFFRGSEVLLINKRNSESPKKRKGSPS